MDHQGHVVDVKWCQVYPKEHRLLFDLYAQQSMLTVTGKALRLRQILQFNDDFHSPDVVLHSGTNKVVRFY